MQNCIPISTHAWCHRHEYFFIDVLLRVVLLRVLLLRWVRRCRRRVGQASDGQQRLLRRAEGSVKLVAKARAATEAPRALDVDGRCVHAVAGRMHVALRATQSLSVQPSLCSELVFSSRAMPACAQPGGRTW